MTCTEAENSFALPDPLRNLAAPAKPALAAADGPGRPHERAAEALPGATGGGAPIETQPEPVRRRRRTAAPYRDLSWILYPGLYPGGLEVSNGATAYLMPGIYWIGGGGVDIGGGGSIVSIGAATDAKPTSALRRAPRRPPPRRCAGAS